MEKRGTVVKQKGTRSYLFRADDVSVHQRNRKHLSWLPKCADEEVPPSQPTPELVLILPHNFPSDATSMSYQIEYYVCVCVYVIINDIIVCMH